MSWQRGRQIEVIIRVRSMIQLKIEHRDDHRIYTLSSFTISLIALLFYFTQRFGHNTGTRCSQGHKATMHDIKKS